MFLVTQKKETGNNKLWGWLGSIPTIFHPHFLLFKEEETVKKGKSKFNVSTTEADIKKRQSIDYYTGKPIVFMSKLEKKYYDEVVLAGMNDGSIIKYELQHKYLLQPKFQYFGKTILPIYYVSDFDITYKDGSFAVIDTKGMGLPDAKLKAKQFKYTHQDIILKWVSHTKATGWIEYDALQKIRLENKRKRG